MMGYVLALLVDKLSGASLAEQQGSFLGLLALHVTVFAILAVRCVPCLFMHTCVRTCLGLCRGMSP
jgi:hypothetical protein